MLGVETDGQKYGVGMMTGELDSLPSIYQQVDVRARAGLMPDNSSCQMYNTPIIHKTITEDKKKNKCYLISVTRLDGKVICDQR